MSDASGAGRGATSGQRAPSETFFCLEWEDEVKCGEGGRARTETSPAGPTPYRYISSVVSSSSSS